MVDAKVDYLSSGNFIFRYNIYGALDQLVFPGPAAPERTDHLWQNTCFEAFIGAQGGTEYLELNLSPSAQWAVYAFENYREGMSNPDLASPPRIESSMTTSNFELVATVNLGGLPALETGRLEMALAAVLEEKNGRKSLWALKHSLGNPDFHNRDCFIHKFETAEI
tara:strand:- start:114 stop:611 length:498 start_codon:yes stop_codon:yes gene_type:complete